MVTSRVLWLAILYLFTSKCLGSKEAIVKPVARGEIPYIVSIQENGKHKCGGSILDELHILTAAHCIINTTYTTHPSELKIQYGVLDIAQETKNKVQVTNIKYHERYNPSKKPDDIAILTLAEEIKLGPEVVPVELPGAVGPLEDLAVIVSGWGQQWGNSGGPLVIKNTRIIVGIASWSETPSDTTAYPAVFVRVTDYVEWIRENSKKSPRTDL